MTMKIYIFTIFAILLTIIESHANPFSERIQSGLESFQNSAKSLTDGQGLQKHVDTFKNSMQNAGQDFTNQIQSHKDKLSEGANNLRTQANGQSHLINLILILIFNLYLNILLEVYQKVSGKTKELVNSFKSKMSVIIDNVNEKFSKMKERIQNYIKNAENKLKELFQQFSSQLRRTSERSQ